MARALSKRNRTVVAAAVYAFFLGLQVALLVFVRGHGPDWFAGGNADAQMLADLSLGAIGAALLVEVALCSAAVWIARRRRAWALLPVPVMLVALAVLVLAASGPGSGG